MDLKWLYQVLDGVEAPTVADFEQFVKKPLPQSSEALEAFVKLLKKHQGDWDNPKLSDVALLRTVFKRAASSGSVARLRSDTLHVLFDYFIQRLLDQHPLERQLLLLEALFERGLDAAFEREARHMADLLSDYPQRDASWYLAGFRLEDLRRKYAAKNRRPDFDLAPASDALNSYLLLEKLRYGCFALLMNNVLKVDVPAGLVAEIQFLTERHAGLIGANPVVDLYAALFDLYSRPLNPYDLAPFGAVNQLFDSAGSRLSDDDRRETYNLAMNYYIHVLNQADFPNPESWTMFFQRMFEVFERMDRHDLLQEGGFIAPQRFKNVVSAAVNAGQMHWAAAFIDDRIRQVAPPHQYMVKLYSLGALYFFEGKYPEAVQQLLKVRNYSNPKDFFYYDCYSLLLRAHLENGEAESFWTDYKNVRKKLGEDEHLSSGRLDAYAHFFHFLQKIARFQFSGPEQTSLEDLQLELSQLHPITQKKWLLEKLQTLAASR